MRVRGQAAQARLQPASENGNPGHPLAFGEVAQPDRCLTAKQTGSFLNAKTWQSVRLPPHLKKPPGRWRNPSRSVNPLPFSPPPPPLDKCQGPSLTLGGKLRVPIRKVGSGPASNPPQV